MAILDTANSLTSVANVQAFGQVPETDQDEIRTLINGASEMLNTLTNRKLKARALTEYYDGTGSDTILLRQRPCNSVTTLHDDPERSWGSTTLVTATDYTVITDEGLIVATGTSFSVGVKVLKIVYNGGLSTIPVDLELACLELVMYWYNRHFKQKIGIASVSRGDSSTTYDQNLPRVVETVAAKYRKYWLG